VPPPGTTIGLDLNDAGRLALGGSMGPEIRQVEGRLVQRDSGEYLVAVTAIHLLSGGQQTWRGENVRIKSEYVSSLYERRFSAARSAAFAAAGVGAVAAVAASSLIGQGKSDPGRLPTDSGQTQRRPRP